MNTVASSKCSGIEYVTSTSTRLIVCPREVRLYLQGASEAYVVVDESGVTESSGVE